MAATRWKGSVYGGAGQPTAALPAPDPIGQANSGGTGGMVSTAMTFEEAMANANARGPGWGVGPDGRGGYEVRAMNQDQIRENSLPPLAAPPTLPTDPMANRPAAPAGPLTPQMAVGRYGANLPGFESAFAPPTARQNTLNQPATAPGAWAPGTSAPTPALDQGPAEMDRANIDRLLGNVSRANSGLLSLGQRDLEFSAAQAQLQQGLDQGQRQSLSLARSGSRRDRAGNEARAIQAGSEMASQTSQAAAGLRATEEAAQQQIRLDAYKAAGDLGLNSAALELDVSKMNMDAATNFLNQTFNRENIQLNLDQQEAERVTNFVRDMALLDKDYYALSQQERDAVRQDLTRRHGISESTRLGLEQLEATGGVNWTQVGATLGAAAIGATATILTAGAAAPAAAAGTAAVYGATG
jgi:hypothetical protein